MLAEARARGPEAAMDDAAGRPQAREDRPGRPTSAERIDELCEAPLPVDRPPDQHAKYHASGAERGAVLDFVDIPLNNRWWLEDEFTKIRALPLESRQGRAPPGVGRLGEPGTRQLLRRRGPPVEVAARGARRR